MSDVTSETGLLALKRETTIHCSIDHPHIVRMWQVLKDKDNIYMVMDHVEGGNLFYYQNKHQAFGE